MLEVYQLMLPSSSNALQSQLSFSFSEAVNCNTCSNGTLTLKAELRNEDIFVPKGHPGLLSDMYFRLSNDLAFSIILQFQARFDFGMFCLLSIAFCVCPNHYTVCVCVLQVISPKAAVPPLHSAVGYCRRRNSELPM